MLNPHRLQRLLTTAYCGRDLWQLCRTASTNAVLWRRYYQGSPPGATVIATRQVAGQGQWGRSWQSDPGGLYLSVLLGDIRDPPSPLLTLTLTLAWAVVQALRTARPDWQGLRVKWPNDLVWEGQKLGGLLLQTRSHQGSQPVVVGLGLNVHNQPPPPGVSLKNLSQDVVDLTEVAAIVIQALEQGLETWQNKGWSAVQADYQANLWSGSRKASVTEEGLVLIDGVVYHPGEVTLGYERC